jgi:translation initiation factor IF-2
MNNGKVRIYELSKELNLDNRDILTVCDKLSISVKSHSSTITEEEAARIRAAAETYTPTPAQKPASAAQSPSTSKPSGLKPPVKKQQILEIRRNRPLSEPPKRPDAEVAAAPVAAASSAAPTQPSRLSAAPSRPGRPGEAPGEAIEDEAPEIELETPEL